MNSKKKNLISTIYELGQRFKNASSYLQSFNSKTLKEKIENSIKYSDDSLFHQAGKKLLNDETYRHLILEEPQVLVHYDLHRSNILFLDDDSVRILDFGSTLYAPSSFLPASLFMSSFMLQQEDDFCLDNLMDYWPDNLDKKSIVILMLARTIIGGTFFQKKISENNYSSEDYQIYQKYLNSIKLINNILKE